MNSGFFIDLNGQLSDLQDGVPRGVFLQTAILPDLGSGATDVAERGRSVAESAGTCQWGGSGFEGESTLARVDDGCWQLEWELRALADVSFARIGFRSWLMLGTPHYLASTYRLEPVKKRHAVDAWTPLALTGKSAGRWAQVVADQRPMVVGIRRTRRGAVQLDCFLDHELAHPRFHFDEARRRHWRNRYRWPAGHRLRASLRILRSPKPRPLIVPGRLPARFRAAMTITDHADHDTTAKLRALLYGSSAPTSPSADLPKETRRGFAQLRLGFTKSIFTGTETPDGPGLHNPEFAEVCAEAERAGLEICPHGIHQRVQPAAEDVESTLAVFEPFSGRSWIDHGFSFQTTHVKQGWNRESDFYLMPHLDRHGIEYLWGFLDFGQAVPARNLDQLQIDHFSGWRFFLDQFRLLRRSMQQRKPWAVLHGVSVVLFQSLPDRAFEHYFNLQLRVNPIMTQGKIGQAGPALVESLKLVACLMRPSSLRELWANVRRPRVESLQLAPLLFREHNAVYEERNDRWIFNTLSVHDVADAFAPECVDRLIFDFGIHFAHTYLGSTSAAHISHPLERVGDQDWQLTADFAANLSYIADRCREGTLWFAPLPDLADGMRRQRDVRVVPDASGWTVRSATRIGDRELQLIAFDLADPLIFDGRPCEGEPIDSRRQLLQLDLEGTSDGVRLEVTR